uniref:Uncharacterized protein n=1 Tax=Oryza meridionalis TaxID=40149 RepID=A0A0E0D6P6_9ORYZ
MDGADHPGVHFGGPARGIYFYYFNPPEEEYQRAQREKRKIKKRRGKKARALHWPHPLPHQFVYLFIYLFSSSFTQWLAWTSAACACLDYFYCCLRFSACTSRGRERERERERQPLPLLVVVSTGAGLSPGSCEAQVVLGLCQVA